MIGLMLGSTRVLWPWPLGLKSTALEAPSDPVVLPIVLAIVGAAVVVVVERFSSPGRPRRLTPPTPPSRPLPTPVLRSPSHPGPARAPLWVCV